MYATSFGETPKWSTPEIEAAINAFGWYDLHIALHADMSIIRAQIRRFYEDACERIERKARNEALLGIGGNILGISESKPEKQLPSGNTDEQVAKYAEMTKMLAERMGMQKKR